MEAGIAWEESIAQEQVLMLDQSSLFVLGGDMYNDFTELPVWHC